MRALAAKGLITNSIQVDTQEGLRWALANLHPCGEGMAEAVGYPDDNNLPTHCTRMQKTTTVSPPVTEGTCTGNTGPSIDMCSWNCLVVTTPWPEFPWLVCKTKGNTEPTPLSEWLKMPNNIIQNGDNGTQTNWGVWTLYAFPNFMDVSKEVGDSNDVRKKYQKLRVIAKGTTTYLNASRLYDGGRVICGQYPVAARYLDTFEPNSVSIDMEGLVDKIISRLCVEGSGSFSPEEIKRITSHTHQLKLAGPDVKSTVDVSGGLSGEVVPKVVMEKTGDVTAQVTPEVSMQKVGQISASVHPDVQLTVHKPDVQGSVKAGQNTLSGDLKFDVDSLKHYHDVPKLKVTEETLRPVLQHQHLVEVTNIDGTAVKGRGYAEQAMPQDPQPAYLTIDYTNSPIYGSAPPSGAVDYTGFKVEASAPEVIVDVQAPKIDVTTRMQDVNVRDNTDYNAITHQQDVQLTDSVQWTAVGQSSAVNIDDSRKYTVVSEVTPPTGVTLLPDYVNPEPAEAETCLKLSKTGDALQNVKLVKDDKVTDHPDWYISDPPCTENELFYGDSKATTWAARLGTYQVVRINNWELDDLHSGSATFYDLRKWEDRDVIPRTYSSTFTVHTQGTGTWAVAYYRNINMATSLTLKCVQFTEGVANPTGPFANLTPLNTDPDPAAIALVTEENRRLAHAYPSSYNDLGSILGQIFNVAKSIGKAVSAASSQLTNVPLIGDVAKGLSTVLGSLGL